MLKTDTISNIAATKQATTDQIVDGIAKAWINFNGITSVIRKAMNVSSLVKNTAGDYTVNFAVPMPDLNYSIGGCASQMATNTFVTERIQSTSPRTTGSSRILSAGVNGSIGVATDCDSVSAQWFC